ncbi:MAG TPA: N-acetylglucosamine-6-phosphate deacetylase [Oscillatoriaceae cyanobacterium]
MSELVQIAGGRVVTPEGLRDDVCVTIAGDRILELGPARDGARRLDVHGAFVAPGLIDTHVHGGLEWDAMDASVDALKAIARHLAAHGVTGWLPTTVACPAPQLAAILATIESAMSGTGGAEILGAHLESNFLAPAYHGAQPLAYLRAPDDAELLSVIARYKHVIRVLTLAPELEGAIPLIRQLVAWGIVVAVGHTEATFAQVEAAVEAGATRVTHLCNAQRGFHHREPGTLGAGLAIDALSAEIIADLEHVHPAGLTIAYRCKGPERLMLVSDALRGTGLPPGRYELGGQLTVLDGRVARLESGTIAGSTITLERAVAHMAREVGVPWHTAFAMGAAAPARSLGLGDRGAIAPGLRADLALYDADWRPTATMIRGRWLPEVHA